MKIERDSKLVMIGDSITDAGRTLPGVEDPLGRGYVTIVEGLLTATYPERRIRVVNMGIGGNTVRDLKGRWERDVVEQRPEWLSVMIGINDVWRQFDKPLAKEIHVYREEYEETLRGLVKQVRGALKGLVLMTPFFIEPHRGDAMRVEMDAYGKMVRAIAEESGAIFVDVQGAFDRVLKHRHAMALAKDRVHPNQAGHMVIARAFLEGVGYGWGGE